MGAHNCIFCGSQNCCRSGFIDSDIRIKAFCCEICGDYYLSYELSCRIGKDRGILFSILHHHLISRDNAKTPVYGMSDNPQPDEKFDFICVNDLRVVPSGITTERIEKTLVNLSKFYEFPKYVEEPKRADAIDRLKRLTYTYNEGDLSEVTKEIHMFFILLREKEYISSSGPITITAKGYELIQKIIGTEKHLPKVFIAMWFDKSMDVARNAIKAAVKDCGYSPFIMSEHEHNDQIVPELLRNIKESHFLIADLTGNRGGVYFEAGYALGLGKEVIMTCRKNKAKSVHFDVAQISTIRWESEEELQKKLVLRILATLGTGPNRNSIEQD